MSVGDNAELLTPGKCGVPFVIGEMKDEGGQSISATSHPYMLFTMKMPFAVKSGDIIRAG